MTDEQLLALYRDATGVSTDTRTLRPGDLFVALRGPAFDGNAYAAAALEAGASAVVVDDDRLVGRARHHVVHDGLAALQQLARAYRRTWTCPVVALTGSNGKTTTKELLAACLATTYEVAYTAGNLNNHIGVPLTLLRVDAEAVDVVVVEMGANHQGEIAELCAIAEPTHGFITNVGRAHLEGFGGEDGVRKGKGELFDYLARTRGCAFADAADATVAQMSERVATRLLYASAEPAGGEYARPVLTARLEQDFPQIRCTLEADSETQPVTCRLPGAYNYRNLVQAASVAHYFKVPLGAIAEACAAYEPRAQRSEQRRVGEATVLLDAYNANPDSMRAGLSWLYSREETRRVAVLGEMKELGPFGKTAHADLLREVAEVAEAEGVEVLLTGAAYGELLGDGVEREGADVQWFPDRDQLTEAVAERLGDAEAVLLFKGSRSNRLEQVLAKAAERYETRL